MSYPQVAGLTVFSRSWNKESPEMYLLCLRIIGKELCEQERQEVMRGQIAQGL